jgi:hypothetical protein
MTSIDSRHRKISTGLHFQNGRDNTAKIQHCEISSKWKWQLVEIFRCQESIRDIIIYLHMKCRWNRTMLNLCGIVAAILKMVTARDCSMSRIDSRHWKISTGRHNTAKIQHCPISSKFDMLVDYDIPNWFLTHNLPTYEMSLTSDNDEFVRYCGSHFENNDW